MLTESHGTVEDDMEWTTTVELTNFCDASNSLVFVNSTVVVHYFAAVYICLFYCFFPRAIYDTYQNIYNVWLAGESQETIDKVKVFYQKQVWYSRCNFVTLPSPQGRWGRYHGITMMSPWHHHGITMTSP